MSQSRDIHFTLFEYSVRLITSMQNAFRRLLHPLISLSSRASSAELLIQIEQATTPLHLTQMINNLQDLLWNLPSQEQALQRKKLIAILNTHLLESSNSSLRLEAASWLRMLMQAGLVTHPEDIFVTLVTAACSAPTSEQESYLKMIFDCFWPFRYPYPAYERDLFPANSVFYPLAPLLSSCEQDAQEMLIAIFAELPELDDAEIVKYLLPIALAWANSPNPERRGRVATLLARMSDTRAQEALCHLQADADATVRTLAKRAAENILSA